MLKNLEENPKSCCKPLTTFTMLLTLFLPISNNFLLSWVVMSDFPGPWLPWITCWGWKWAFTYYSCMQNYISCLSPWGMVWPVASNSLFQELQKVLRAIKITFYLFFFFPFSLDYVRTSISKHAILKVSGGKIKTGREITAPLWTLACYARYAQSPVPPHPIPQSKVPLKISEPQTGPHPMLPISSENSGSQSNPGLPFTLMDKQKHRSGESNNEYSWLNKMPTFLC